MSTRQRKTRTTPNRPARAADPSAAPFPTTASRKLTRTSKTAAPMVVREPRQLPTHEEIARQAYAIWERRGYANGHDVDDWLQAENELLTQ